MNDVRVDLLKREELMGTGGKGGLKLGAIFVDGLAGVPFHVIEVENPFGLKLTETAGASAEAVDEPGKPGKGGKFEDLQAFGLAKEPGRGDRRTFRG